MRKTILDFSGIYREQPSMKEWAEDYLDGTGLRGTDCYCDPETEKELVRQLEKMPAGGIHLMDSGNYHYVSKLFLETCAGEVSLVVLDHHTDMQPPALLPVLSCGSWLLDTLRENPRVRQVFLIGPPQEALDQIPVECRERLLTISQEELGDGSWREILGTFRTDWPVYVSVDKDVLAPEVCRTNWDQGTMRLEEMMEILRWFAGGQQIAGVDICGEPDHREALPEELRQSSRVTRCVADFFDGLDKREKEG